MKNIKNYLISFTLAISLIPSVSFASNTNVFNVKEIHKSYSVIKNNRLMLSVKDFAKNYGFKYTDDISIHPVTGLRIREICVNDNAGNMLQFVPTTNTLLYYKTVGNETVVNSDSFKGYFFKNNKLYVPSDTLNFYFNKTIGEDSDPLNNSIKYPKITKNKINSILKEKGPTRRNALADYDDPEAIVKSLNNILNKVNLEGLNEKQKLRVLHNELCRIASYDYDNIEKSQESPWAFSSTGIAKYRKAVCSGYAEYYMLLCNAVGLDVNIVHGKVNGRDHAWNTFYKDGIRYNIDPTWNDTGCHFGKWKWFYKTDKEMNETGNIFVIEKEFSKNLKDFKI